MRRVNEVFFTPRFGGGETRLKGRELSVLTGQSVGPLTRCTRRLPRVIFPPTEILDGATGLAIGLTLGMLMMRVIFL